MFSIHQLLKALRKLQANEINASDLVKSLQYAMIAGSHNNSLHSATTTAKHLDAPLWMTSLLSAQSMTSTTTTTSSKTHITASSATATPTATETAIAAEGEETTAVTVSPKQQQQTRASSHEHEINETENISETSSHCQQMSNIESSSSSNSHKLSISEHVVSLYSNLNEVGSLSYTENTCTTTTTTQDSSKINIPTTIVTTAATPQQNFCNINRSQSIQNFYQQQLHQFHTQHNQSLYAKQKQIQFAMSSLAAEPLSLKSQDEILTKHSISNGDDVKFNGNEIDNDSSTSNVKSPTTAGAPAAATGKPCFNTGLAEILQFMELIGNLKHTKRTGWVLRDVNDCESISGHMYRMSMMTFLLDGTEGLNQIRCMELALVHDLAESLVGDITPFCGVSKDDKRSMEFKAMEEICKLIEPRGKRIMELFEEYEHGQSAESKFVKDLDRLDMVMQAFEYEKRDNCLLKHQEFFDSTEGKFQHPFVQKLVQEIYEQRKDLAKAKGATPPPTLNAPNMEEIARKLNGHCAAVRQQEQQEQEQQEQSTSSSTS